MSKKILRVLADKKAAFKTEELGSRDKIEIIAERNSRVVIMENVRPKDSGCAEITLQAEAGADISWFVSAQSLKRTESSRKIYLRDKCRLQMRSAFFSNNHTRHNQAVYLTGYDAELCMENVVVSGDGNNFDLDSVVSQSGKRAKSEIGFRGVAGNNSRISCRMLSKIGEGSADSAAIQKIDYLLLSASSEVFAAPRLEINNNDVLCKHAMTSNRVNEEELFYAQSRGISERKAKTILGLGFLEMFFEGYPEEMKSSLRSRAEKIINSATS